MEMKMENVVKSRLDIKPEICWCCEQEIDHLDIAEYDTNTFIMAGEKKIPTGMIRTLDGYCPLCGASVPNRKVDKMRAKTEDQFIEEHNPDALTIKVLASLPRRYNISRANFETVLNIHEIHEIDGRYVPFDLWAGEVRNDAEEEALLSVKNNPEYYLELLHAAKGLIPDDAYERSLKRTEELIAKNK